jgi:hypothetical protein
MLFKRDSSLTGGDARVGGCSKQRNQLIIDIIMIGLIKHSAYIGKVVIVYNNVLLVWEATEMEDEQPEIISYTFAGLILIRIIIGNTSNIKSLSEPKANF